MLFKWWEAKNNIVTSKRPLGPWTNIREKWNCEMNWDMFVSPTQTARVNSSHASLTHANLLAVNTCQLWIRSGQSWVHQIWTQSAQSGFRDNHWHHFWHPFSLHSARVACYSGHLPGSVLVTYWEKGRGYAAEKVVGQSAFTVAEIYMNLPKPWPRPSG